MDDSLLIIGGGVAGLTAGCYARMNGYETTILEMEDTPGGLCTSWKRRGYMFDGSVAGLAGSAPGSPIFQLWKEIGVADYCPLHYGENFGHIRLPDGRVVTIYANIDRLEKHLLEVFPAEAEPIREFTNGLRSTLTIDVPFSSAQGWKAVQEGIQSFIGTLSYLPALMKFSSISIRQYAEKFHDPDLKMVFNNIVHFGGPDVPMLTMLLPLAYAHRGMAGIPLKGWLSFARAIERKYLELGGRIRYGVRVDRVKIEDGRVKGVILANGDEIPSTRVLSAADGRFSHSHLMGLPLDQMRQTYAPEELSDQPVQVNIGVNEDFSSEDGPFTFILPEAPEAAGRKQLKLTVHNKYYDPDSAPQGKSALTAFLDSEYGWWKDVSADPERYKEEKDHCAELVIGVLEQTHPGIRDRIEVIDVSTPLTRERYTGNWMGAMQARKPNSSLMKSMLQGGPRYAYPGVDGMYMAGQWVEAWGGITTAAQSGRKVIQAICKKDGKRFTSQ